MMTRSTVVVVASLALVAFAQPAGAVHLEKVDEQIAKDSSPPFAQQGGECTGDAFIFASAIVEPGRAVISTTSRANAVGQVADCSITETNSLTVILTFDILPDPGDVPGTPVQLCLQEAHDVLARDSGNGTATAEFGGSPITNPFTVVRLPANQILYSAGPLSVSDDREQGSATKPVTAAIGDTIRITLGATTQAATMGVGSAEAAVATEFRIRLGACSPGAPVLSPAALAALALLRGAFGAVVLRRRRA